MVPETKRQAQILAELQQDPLKLARYLVEKYDERKKFGKKYEGEEALNPETRDEDFDEKSPRLPVETTFEATIKTTGNPKALTLVVNEASIKLPEVRSKTEKKRERETNPETENKASADTSQRDTKTVSKPSVPKLTPKVAKVENTTTKNWWDEEPDDINAMINSKKSQTVKHEEPTAKTPANTSKSEEYGKLLIDKISTKMSKGDRDLTKEQKFTVCNWTVTVRPSQLCTVRDEGNDQVFKCNLRTKETLMPLSDYDANRLDEAVQLKRAERLKQENTKNKRQWEA